MKEEYIEQLLAESERCGALRRGVRARCDEIDSRLSDCAGMRRRRYNRTVTAVLAVLLLAVGGLNVALAAHNRQTLLCNSDCDMQQILTEADGVIASCRQNTMI